MTQTQQPTALNMTPQLVFVYGTLKEGYGNHKHYLEGKSKFIGATSVPGVLVHLGSFPGLKDDDMCRVAGEVYEVTWDVIGYLDSLEGTPDLYERRQINTPLGLCWTYYWTRLKSTPLTDHTLVVNEGVWRGGRTDKVGYRVLREFFKTRQMPVTSATNTPPAHISEVGKPEVPAALLPAPKMSSEPVVGPGVELWP